MDKVNLKRKLNKKEPKLSFGLALKNNVFQNFNPKFILLLQIRNNTNTQGQRTKKLDTQKQKHKVPSISISKIDESYNTDKASDIFNKEMEPVINKLDNNKSYYQEKSNLSENSFLNNTNKVSIKLII